MNLRNFDFFASYVFKSIEILLGHIVVKRESNWNLRLPVVCSLLCKKICLPGIPQKNVGMNLRNFDFSAYYVFKSGEILLGHIVVESKSNWILRIPVVCRLLCKKICLPGIPQKNVGMNLRNFDFSAYCVFKSGEILLGHIVVESKSNWNLRIPVVCRLLCKKICLPGIRHKNVGMNLRIFDFFAYYVFKSGEFLLGHIVVESESNWNIKIQIVCRLLCKKICLPGIPQKNVGMNLRNFDFSAYYVFKSGEFLLGHIVVESESNWNIKIQIVCRLLCKKICLPGIPQKNVGMNLRNFDFSAYYVFKSGEILLGHIVVESKSNWNLRIPVVCRLLCKKICLPGIPQKNVGMNLRNFDFSAYYVFKSGEILLGHIVVESKSNWNLRIPVVCRLLCKKICLPGIRQKNVGMNLRIFDFFAYYVFKSGEFLLGHIVVESESNWNIKIQIVCRLLCKKICLPGIPQKCWYES